MIAGLVIRDAFEADLAAIASLYESSGVDAPGAHDATALAASWQRLRREAPTARVLLAEEGGRPVGTLTCFVLPLLNHGGTPAALVEGVAVDPAAQGRGIGRALMDAAMAIAREAGCYKLALSSNDKRREAHAFYERLGYARHGVSFVAFVEDLA
ncbi:MAG TPA: GNAT family N-acetyltransferase [Albitalea sp.]|uniref:GNAT family N-acetyltransferase n=1 Tax=Piscinibacter sp. TaxID=1903157 RepID=UPI002ED0C552